MHLSVLKLTIAILFSWGLYQPQPFLIQSVLNADARLTVRLCKFSHISSLTVTQLHWLPLLARMIQLKFLSWSASPDWAFLQSISEITFAPVFLQLLIDLSTHWTSVLSLFHDLGPLWPKLEPLLPWNALLSSMLNHSFQGSSCILFSPQCPFLFLGFLHWECYYMATAVSGAI